MKKIKISEQQAKMLKDLGKTKVLKITQEQYSRIVELEKLNEVHKPIELAFRQNLSNAARKDFNKMEEGQSGKINEIYEMYESFISELYGVNENTEKKHGKLIKLMELAGLVNNNRLVKEKFNNDKNLVEYVMCEALYEMHNGCSEYKVMEMIEQQLDLFKDYQGKPETVNVDNESYKKRLEDWLYNNKNHDNYRYFKNQYEKGQYQNAINDITRLKEENKDFDSKDEATMAGSSGAYVGQMGGNPIHKTNVVDELITEIDPEIDIDPETEVLHDVVDLLSSVIRSPSVTPKDINKHSHILIKSINILKDVNIDADDIMFNSFLPNLIKTLIYYSRNISNEGMFKTYINHIKHVYQIINALKDDINVTPFPYEEDLLEQGIQNSGAYDTPGFDNPSMTGDTPRGTGPTWKKPTIAGGTEVKVKEKCSKFPYCNQGSDAIEISK